MNSLGSNNEVAVVREEGWEWEFLVQEYRGKLALVEHTVIHVFGDRALVS